MPILFPLTLIGVGFLIYALFASATLALPIGAGLAAGFGSCTRSAVAPLPSVIIGIAAFMSVICDRSLRGAIAVEPPGSPHG